MTISIFALKGELDGKILLVCFFFVGYKFMQNVSPSNLNILARLSAYTGLLMDSRNQQIPPCPRYVGGELHNKLIEISESFCSEDLEVLKFLCYDILPGN